MTLAKKARNLRVITIYRVGAGVALQEEGDRVQVKLQVTGRTTVPQNGCCERSVLHNLSNLPVRQSKALIQPDKYWTLRLQINYPAQPNDDTCLERSVVSFPASEWILQNWRTRHGPLHRCRSNYYDGSILRWPEHHHHLAHDASPSCA